jgi:hypothetical protein
MLPEPIKRLYTVADAYIIQFAKTLRGVFINDQATFVARDPSFNTPYETDWLNAINAAEAQDSDETVDDQLTQLTAVVDAEMELCRILFQDAKPFIRKAFPNMPGRWNEFGFDDYDAARKNQPFMLEFMSNFHKAATRYAPPLLAVNVTQAMIDEIETRRAALNTANDTQENFKKMMQGLTEQRIITLNAMYGYCTNVCETGKLVMRTSYAGYQRYLLPASDEPSGVMALLGKASAVDATGVAVGAEGVTVTVQELGLSTTTDSNGNYGFGPLPAGTYTLQYSKAGFIDQALSEVVVTGPDSAATVNVTMVPMGSTPSPAG